MSNDVHAERSISPESEDSRLGGVLQADHALSSARRKENNKLNAEVNEILKSFERAGEWADLSNSLTRLHSAFHVYSKKFGVGGGGDRMLYDERADDRAQQLFFLVQKETLARRLVQCLNQNLPTGVHIATLETFDAIFECIGRKALSRDIGFWTIGLFSFVQYASILVKTNYLVLLERRILCLSQDTLRQACDGIVFSLIPCLEDDKSHTYPHSILLMARLCMACGTKLFVQCLWRLLNHYPKFRTPVFDLILKGAHNILENPEGSYVHGPRSSDPPAAPAIQELSDAPPALVETLLPAEFAQPALIAILEDPSPTETLIKRAVLDFLIEYLPCSSPLLLERPEFGVRLMQASSGTLISRDASLTRRFHEWVCGGLMEGQVKILSYRRYALPLLVKSFQPFQTSQMLSLRVVLEEMEEAFGQLLAAELAVDLHLCVCREESSVLNMRVILEILEASTLLAAYLSQLGPRPELILGLLAFLRENVIQPDAELVLTLIQLGLDHPEAMDPSFECAQQLIHTMSIPPDILELAANLFNSWFLQNLESDLWPLAARTYLTLDFGVSLPPWCAHVMRCPKVSVEALTLYIQVTSKHFPDQLEPQKIGRFLWDLLCSGRDDVFHPFFLVFNEAHQELPLLKSKSDIEGATAVLLKNWEGPKTEGYFRVYLRQLLKFLWDDEYRQASKVALGFLLSKGMFSMVVQVILFQLEEDPQTGLASLEGLLRDPSLGCSLCFDLSLAEGGILCREDSLPAKCPLSKPQYDLAVSSFKWAEALAPYSYFHQISASHEIDGEMKTLAHRLTLKLLEVVTHVPHLEIEATRTLRSFLRNLFQRSTVLGARRIQAGVLEALEMALRSGSPNDQVHLLQLLQISLMDGGAQVPDQDLSEIACRHNPLLLPILFTGTLASFDFFRNDRSSPTNLASDTISVSAEWVATWESALSVCPLSSVSDYFRQVVKFLAEWIYQVPTQTRSDLPLYKREGGERNILLLMTVCVDYVMGTEDLECVEVPPRVSQKFSDKLVNLLSMGGGLPEKVDPQELRRCDLMIPQFPLLFGNLIGISTHSFVKSEHVTMLRQALRPLFVEFPLASTVALVFLWHQGIGQNLNLIQSAGVRQIFNEQKVEILKGLHQVFDYYLKGHDSGVETLWSTMIRSGSFSHPECRIRLPVLYHGMWNLIRGDLKLRGAEPWLWSTILDPILSMQLSGGALPHAMTTCEVKGVHPLDCIDPLGYSWLATLLLDFEGKSAASYLAKNKSLLDLVKRLAQCGCSEKNLLFWSSWDLEPPMPDDGGFSIEPTQMLPPEHLAALNPVKEAERVVGRMAQRSLNALFMISQNAWEQADAMGPVLQLMLQGLAAECSVSLFPRLRKVSNLIQKANGGCKSRVREGLRYLVELHGLTRVLAKLPIHLMPSLSKDLWRRTLYDHFLAPSFFFKDATLLTQWQPLIHQLVNLIRDKKNQGNPGAEVSLSDLLYPRVDAWASAHSNILALSRAYLADNASTGDELVPVSILVKGEGVLKTAFLKRLSFVILSMPHDTFSVQMRWILEQLVDALRVGPEPDFKAPPSCVRHMALILMQVIMLRISPYFLNNMWTVVTAELINIESEERPWSRLSETRIQVAQMAVSLGFPEFSPFHWIFQEVQDFVRDEETQERAIQRIVNELCEVPEEICAAFV